MKKFMIMFLMLALVAVLVACTSKDNEGGEKSEENEGSKPAQLSVLLRSVKSMPFQENWSQWSAIQKETNTKLKFNVSVDDFNSAVNLDVASGSPSDLIFMSTYQFANGLGEKGALVNLLDYLDHAPNLKKFLDDHPDIATRFYSSDRKLYVAPNEGFGQTDRRTWSYREDIFKENGLSVPTNLDELYQVLMALKQKYPNSNPLAIRGGMNSIFDEYSLLFDTAPTAFYDVDKKEWRYGPADDHFKSMVAFFRKLYKDGLIMKDLVVGDAVDYYQAMSTDISFMAFDYFELDDFNNTNRETNSKYNLLYMPPLKTVADKDPFVPNLHLLNNGYSIAAGSKNVKEAIKFIDWFYTPQAIVLNSWGIEGDTYNVVNGVNTFHFEKYPTMTDARVKTGLATNGTYLVMDFDAHVSTFQEETQTGFNDIKKYDVPPQPSPAFNGAELETLSIKGEPVTKYMKEMVTAFVIGNKDLSKWDQYVKELKRLGSDEVVRVYREAYDRSQGK